MRDGEPLSNQVDDDMLGAVRDESISQEDMEYWFTDNPGDIEEESFMKPLEEIPNTVFNVRNEVWESVCRLHALPSDACSTRRRSCVLIKHPNGRKLFIRGQVEGRWWHAGTH